jgi:6-phospho-3-hexuloisomerase
MSDLYRAALDEIGAVTARLDGGTVDAAAAMISAAGSVVVVACGREGLQIRGFAMRLHHLGLRASAVGEMGTPLVGPGDLLIACAGPGGISTVTALMRVAKEAGAGVLFLTAVSETPEAALADLVLVVPAQTMATDRAAGASAVLPMGSAMEGALFVLFEVMVLKIRALTGATPEAMRARHTNLE